MKKVLIITYNWPPAGGAGVQRWLKMSKFLPEFGWQPIILTVDPKYAAYPQRDESLAKDIHPSIKVHYAKAVDLYGVYKKLTGEKEIPYGGFANETKPSFTQKLSRFVRGNIILPDARVGWNKYAYKKACEIIKSENISTVITTSPPHSTQLIGLKLKRKLNINWIADLRDPWSDIYYNDLLYRTSLAKKWDARLERKTLEHADKITTVSESLKKLLLKKSAKINSDKVSVIYNGFDSEDFNSKIDKNNIFTITYTGTIAENYPLESFISAINAFREKMDIEFKVRFIGKMPPTIQEKLTNKLQDIVEFSSYIPHNKAIEELKKAWLLLLIIPESDDNKGIVTGKIFEYIGSESHILGIGPTDGDAAKIISDTNTGSFADYNNSNKILSIIEEAKKGHGKQTKATNGSIYSRKNLTSDFVKILESPSITCKK